MSLIKFENNQFVFIDDNDNKIELFNAVDPLSNNSHLPSHEVLDDGKTVYPLFDDMISYIDEFDKINEDVMGGLLKQTVILSIFLVTRELLKKQRDLKVLEIGCDKGVLSYYLAKVLSRFNANNRLVCVTDSMGNECDNYWFDKILLSGAGDIVSLVTTEYNNAILPNDYFDIVIINGSVQFAEPAAVIRNAVNSVKNTGLLVCLSERQYLLTSCLQIAVGKSTVYNQDEASTILSKTIDEKDKLYAYKQTNEFILSDYKEKIVDALVPLKAMIKNLNKPQYLTADNDAEIDEKIKLIAQAENDILTIYSKLSSLDIKFNINELKDALIHYKLSDSEDERKSCAKLSKQKYQILIKEMEKYSDFVI